MEENTGMEGTGLPGAGKRVPAHPSLLRGFFDPAHPIELKPWNGAPAGPGVYFDAVPPTSTNQLTARPIDGGNGVVRFPFDPERTVELLVYERGMERGRPLYTYLPFESRRLPASLREFILTRSVRKRLQARNSFPRWPAETVVEEMRQVVLDASRKAGGPGEKAPFWPGGHRYAAALSHDVDSSEAWSRGYWRAFAELEEANGLRSSWHICSVHAERWEKEIMELARRGHEIAWHGPRHDYRIAFLSREKLRLTLAENAQLFGDLGIRGFRSPNYLRTPRLYAGLAESLGYDSSTMDSGAEPLSPLRRTGCCTVFPFFRGNLLVIPLTIPDGLTIRCLTGDDAGAIAAVQHAKLEWIKSVGGLAFAITHPEAWISMRPGSFAAYRKLVERIAADPEAWKALPRDVESWWRTRALGRVA